MKTLFNYINSYNGAIMALTTLVYTILTGIIIFQSRKTIKLTKQQIDSMHTGKVYPSITKIEGALLCLQFENPTTTPVPRFNINLNKEWLAQYKTILPNPLIEEFYQRLKEVNKANFLTLMPNQKIAYVICKIPGEDFSKLIEVPLTVSIMYGDTKIIEEFTFDLESMGSQLIMVEDYVRMEYKKLDKLSEIKQSIERFSNKN